MANKNNKEQEQTGIDNLNESLTSFGSKVEKHKKLIFGIVGGVIVVVLAGFGWYFYRKHVNEKSAEQYSNTMTAAFKEAMKAPEKGDSVLNAYLVKNLTKLAKDEEGKDGANLANINLAEIYYSQGKSKEALAALEAADIKEPLMKMNSLIFKGNCYVDLNKYNDALTAYNEAYEMAKEDNPEIAVHALYEKALVLAAQNKHADALAVYEQIQKEYPASVTAQSMNVEAYAERERALAGK